jgi:hypothetical protein
MSAYIETLSRWRIELALQMLALHNMLERVVGVKLRVAYKFNSLVRHQLLRIGIFIVIPDFAF